MSLGPILLDLTGFTLTDEERELLQHPLVGGVILFARNYQSPDQITAFVDLIHSLREPRLLISVDHEGGRIQRFREGFTKLPAAELIGKNYDQNNRHGLELAEHTGWLMAIELRSVGIDFSFAPVLDIHKGISSVIGDRSFHRDPEVVASLARAFMQGMRRAGMAAVGKHFPGHGSVKEDSHMTIPVDKRRFEDIQLDDLIAFERLIHAGLPAIMPAHVIYPAVDNKPAGFSSVWLKDVLRKQLQFQGIIFSDDISMASAGFAGDYLDRTRTALAAGCDMVLVCNNRAAVIAVLDNFNYSPNPVSQARLIRMHGKHDITYARLRNESEWQTLSRQISRLDIMPELDLGDDAT
jgi:beta-N-acetylhexosaminidase